VKRATGRDLEQPLLDSSYNDSRIRSKRASEREPGISQRWPTASSIVWR